jgi:hypothetical protein
VASPVTEMYACDDGAIFLRHSCVASQPPFFFSIVISKLGPLTLIRVSLLGPVQAGLTGLN